MILHDLAVAPLEDPASVQALRAKIPDSSWPALLDMKRAVESGDWTTASSLVAEALNGKLSPAGLGTREALTEYLMESRGYDYLKASEGRGEGMTDVDAGDFAMRIARDFNAEALRREKVNDPGWIQLATQALAMAEMSAESIKSAVREDALAFQKDLLRTLGPERSQRILSAPYAQFTASLASDLRDAHSLNLRVWELTHSLNSVDRQRFDALRSAAGDAEAVKHFK